MKFLLSFLCFLFVITISFSCKKTLDSTKSTSLKSETSSDVTVPPYKVDMVSLGGGAYQGIGYQGFTIKVTGIFYKNVDDWGNPLPIRTGDPVYGEIQIIDGPGGSVIDEQPNLYPINHLAITYPVWGGGNGEPNHAAYKTAHDAWRPDYDTWRRMYDGAAEAGLPFISVPPAEPLISQFLTNTSAGGFNTITGKLIRSTTGSTFAIAVEDYPVPTPALPASQYFMGYWLSGSTKIYVYVNGYNHSLINKGSLVLNSGLTPATGTFNAASGSVSNFSMTRTTNGVSHTYTYTGPLQGTP